jgi:molybdopterin-guanine dinucleotide biosynthesis protein A
VEFHEKDGTVRSVGCAGLLLTGGSSRRLGTDKATLVVRGERLVDRSSRLLGEVCDPMLEVGPGYGECPSVRETPAGGGPLAALAAGTSALAVRGYEGAALVLAVDLPGIDATVLSWLAEHPAPATVVPIVDGVPQALCARYGADALGAVPALLAAGERSLRALLGVVPVHEAHVDEWGGVASASTFADVDTPEDAARAGIEWPG